MGQGLLPNKLIVLVMIGAFLVVGTGLLFLLRRHSAQEGPRVALPDPFRTSAGEQMEK